VFPDSAEAETVIAMISLDELKFIDPGVFVPESANCRRPQ
jgi:hypothetical protein